MGKTKLNLGALFSGGKDSTYSVYIAKKEGYAVSCLIALDSENKDSYMFHTPSISKTKIQAQRMNIPIIVKKTKGEKEKELEDLKTAILEAKEKYGIEGIVTGALESVYQATRIQKICTELDLHCFNPLWQKDQVELLEELIENKFKVVLSGVFAYPLDEKWVGREINSDFVKEAKALQEKIGFSIIGEGGEFETLVLDLSVVFKAFENY